MKRIMILILAATMFFSMTLCAHAADKEGARIGGGNTIENINTCIDNVVLTISNKEATARTTVYGKAGVTKISISMYLQKKNGNSWTNINTWSGTKNARNYTLSKSVQISKGTYRVKSVIKVYKGASYETITKYSQVKSC